MTEVPSKPSVTICVLGMHRSGTSALTGSLEQAGLFVGDVVQWAPFNRKGNRENLEIRQLNDDVLSFSGGAWNDPPQRLSWNQEHVGRRDELVRKFALRASVWGFKDPRTVLTLPFWRDAPTKLKFVGTFRSPSAVAQSLFNREGMPFEQGLGLWLFYNKIILEEFKRTPFPVICFDLPADAYFQRLTSLILHFGLNVVEATSVDNFFEPELRHVDSQLASEKPNSEVARLYAALCRASFESLR